MHSEVGGPTSGWLVGAPGWIPQSCRVALGLLSFRGTEAVAILAIPNPDTDQTRTSGSGGVEGVKASPWKIWCARRDSNARPLAPEANALSGLSYGRKEPIRKFSGVSGGIRTLDIQIHSLAL